MRHYHHLQRVQELGSFRHVLKARTAYPPVFKTFGFYRATRDI